MKAIVKAAIARVGFRLQNLRDTPRQLQHANNVRALEFDDVVCRHMFEVGAALTFIQVGAFDGITKDPLHRYIQSCGWSGTMIEPQPKSASKLRSLYAENPGINIVEAALDRQHGTRTLFTVDVASAPNWYGGLASFNRQNILKHAAIVPDIEKLIRELQVETTTFDAVLDRFSCHEIDILQIDTEGADGLILSLFPFERIRPAIVHWEVKHLTMDDQEVTLDRLLRHGYRFSPSGSEDMIATRF